MRATWGAIFLVIGFVGCGGEPWPELAPIDHPDLDAVEEVARRQLEEQRDAVSDLVERGRGEPRELAEAYGQLGRLYHAYELLAPARAAYANAETLDPEGFPWPYYLGLVAQAEGRLEAARGHFERALELGPGNPPARLRLGAVLLGLNEPRAADAIFAPLVDDPRYAAAALAGRGRAALAAGDAESAREHLTAALELQPRAGGLHHALGTALRRLGRDDEAREHVGQGAGEVEFEDPLAERLATLAVSAGSHLRRANQALMAGRLDEAAAAYEQAVEIAPDNVAARRNLALTRLRQGDPGAAARQLEAALGTAPDDPQLHLDLGNARLARGDREGAVDALRRAVELAPELVAARFNLANVLAELDRWPEAAGHLEKVLESEPRHARARYLAAMALHHRGRSAEALERLRALADDEPDHAAAFQGLGQVAWHLGRREEAIDHFRRAAELEPDSSAAYTRLANALQLAGRRGEAAELFARAVELDPGNATAWLSEASLRILAGDYALAVARLDRALAAAGDHAGLQHTLARLLATAPDPALRDGARALRLARQAYASEGSLEHAATVGMALAELGRFGDAVRWQQNLIQQAAAAQAPPGELRRLAVHLKRYESGRPIRIEGS